MVRGEKKPSHKDWVGKMSLFWKEIDAMNYAPSGACWLSGFAESVVGYFPINNYLVVGRMTP